MDSAEEEDAEDEDDDFLEDEEEEPRRKVPKTEAVGATGGANGLSASRCLEDECEELQTEPGPARETMDCRSTSFLLEDKARDARA